MGVPEKLSKVIADRFGSLSDSGKNKSSFKTVNYGSKTPDSNMTLAEQNSALTSEGNTIKDLRIRRARKSIKGGSFDDEYCATNLMKNGFAVFYPELKNETERSEVLAIQSLLENPTFKEKTRTGGRSFVSSDDFPKNLNDNQQRCKTFYSKHEQELELFLSDVLWPTFKDMISGDSTQEISNSKLLYNQKRMGILTEQRLHVDFNNSYLHRNTKN